MYSIWAAYMVESELVQNAVTMDFNWAPHVSLSNWNMSSFVAEVSRCGISHEWGWHINSINK